MREKKRNYPYLYSQLFRDLRFIEIMNNKLPCTVNKNSMKTEIKKVSLLPLEPDGKWQNHRMKQHG